MNSIIKSGPGIGFLDARYVNVTGDTMTGPLTIDGSTDTVQLIVQGHSSQGSFLALFENSDAVDQITFGGLGEAVFNEQGNNADFRIEGDTDIVNFVVDASANTVQIGSAATADSAKFYVLGKISTSAEMEINGDLNHDGTNIGFFGVAPAARAGATADIKDALTTYGLLQGTSATNLDLDGGDLLADLVSARLGIFTETADADVVEVLTTHANGVTGLKIANDARNWQLRVDGADADKFIIRDTTAVANRLTISSAGQVAIPGNALVSGNIQVDGAVNHDGTTIGFFGTAPATQAPAYTVTNLTTDRTYDANATSTAELADILGTLIADLRTYGLVQ